VEEAISRRLRRRRSSSFGWTDYPLIDGGKLICTPGGKEIVHVALNKMTGEVLWKSSLPEGIGPSHSPIVVAEVGGRRLYLQNLSSALVGISATDGKLLCRYNRVSNSTMTVPVPFVQGDRVFATSGYGTGSALLQMVPREDSIQIKELYFTNKFQQFYGSYALLGDHVYAGNGPTFGSANPACFDWKRGEVVWQRRGPGAGAVATIAADGHLYFRFADGLMVLAQATPEGFMEKGRFLPPRHSKYNVWSVPVIAHGRLFLRDQQTLVCYDLRRNPPQKASPPADKKPEGQEKSRQPDAVFIPSPPEVVDKMLELAKVTKDDVVYDLGCGDGRIVIAAAKKYLARGVGIEMDSLLVKQARQEAKRQGVDQRVTIKEGDVFTSDFQDATVVALYLLPHLNTKLLPMLKKLRPGTRIVSHAFAIEGVEPDRIVRVRSADGLQEHTVYLWTTPLRQRPSADWPMLGRDQSRNPVSPEKNPPTWWLLGDKKTSRNIKWRVDLSARNKADPVVANGLVWVGGDRPRGFKDRAPALMCFREKDGKFLYQYVTVLPPGEQFEEFKWVGHTSSPFIEGERMWFTTARCETVCLDIGPLQRGTGEPRLLWKVDMHKDLGVYPSQAPMGYGKTCSIAGFRDFVYVQTGNGADSEDKVPAPKAPSLVCFHKKTGKVIWSDNSPGKNIRDGQYASPLVVSINGKG
jgi:outer membrane protein assembly factor BamB